MNDQDHYLVPSSDAEANRLRLQSKLIERPSRFVLEQVGLRPGMRVLDVGCGAGDLMRLMGSVVGASGRVTGIDLNGDLGRRAVAQLNAEGTASYEFICGNFLQMSEPPGGPFDLVVSRLVFAHLHDPELAMRTLWQWTRPGGSLAVMEHDFRLIESVPETEAARMLRHLIHTVHAHAGLDLRCGANLPSLLHKVTGSAPDGVEVTTGLLSARDIAVYLPSTFVAYLHAARQVGMQDLPAQDAFYESLQGALKEDLRFFLPLLIGTWKRKSLS